MRKLIAKLRAHADLAFSVLFVICALLLWGARHERPGFLFFPVFLFSYYEFLAWLYSMWTKVMDFFKDATKWTVDVYANGCQVLREWWGRTGLLLDSWWEQIRHLMFSLYENLKELVEDLWTAVHRFFVELWAAADFLLVKIFERLNYLGETVWGRIESVAKEFWPALKDFISNLYIRVDRLCRDLWDRLMQYGYVLYGKLYDIGYWWYDNARRILSELWLNVDDFFSNLIDRAKIILREKWDWLMALGTGAVGDVIGLVTAKWPVLGWFFTSGWEIWGMIFTDPYRLVYLLMGWIQLKRYILRFQLLWFGEHLLRFLYEEIW